MFRGFSQIKIENKTYVKGGSLGKGGFGEVIKLTCAETKELFALKIIKKKNMDDKHKKFLDREVNIMKTLNHPFIIKFISSSETDNHLKILLEFAPGGNLELYIKKRQENVFSYGSAKENVLLFYQILFGVKYLHLKQIVHRDLKPQNILLDKNKIVKIADFGLVNRSEEKLMSTCAGTSRYSAPEIFSRKRYDGFKADMFSLGAVFYDILTEFSKLKTVSSECLNLSEKLQEYDPFKRPLLDEVVHELKGIDIEYFECFIIDIFFRSELKVGEISEIMSCETELKNGFISIVSFINHIEIENDEITAYIRSLPLLHLQKFVDISDLFNTMIDILKTSVTCLTINTSSAYLTEISNKLIHKDLKEINFKCFQYSEEAKSILENECSFEIVRGLPFSALFNMNSDRHDYGTYFSQFLYELSKRHLVLNIKAREQVLEKTIDSCDSEQFSFNTENVILLFKGISESFPNLTEFRCEFGDWHFKQCFTGNINIEEIMKKMVECKWFDNISGYVTLYLRKNYSEAQTYTIHNSFFVDFEFFTKTETRHFPFRKRHNMVFNK